MPTLSPSEGRLWATYLDFHLGRGEGSNGPSPLTWADLQARQIVTGSRLKPWEVRAVFQIEAEWRAYRSREANNRPGG